MDKLKLMILDDEEWIVKGLATIIDWEAEGFCLIGQYTNSATALEKIRESEPDLLLLDIRMPKISGDMLMEIIREEGIPCEFIIISAYNDFSIAKKAIQHGAFDYILKPIERYELLKAIKKVRKVLISRNNDNHNIPIDPMNLDAFLNQACDAIFNRTDKQYYQLLIFNKLPLLALPEIPNTSFTRIIHIYGGRLMALAYSKKNDCPCSEDILSKWAQTNQLAVGISKIGYSLQEFNNLYRQANCALCCTNIQEKSGCFCYTPPDIHEVYCWIERLKSVYQTGNTQQIRMEISNLIDTWKLHGNPASISLFISQLTYIVVSEDLIKINQLNVDKFLYDDISSQFSNITEIFEYILQLLDPKNNAESQNMILAPQTVRDIKQYIQDNYMDEFNLTKLSVKFFLTPTYLCELFKRFTGYTITSYLLKVRMEKASDLLISTDLSLVDVSGQIGYNDYNYFCRLFKRYFNISPNLYRKNSYIKKHT